MILFIFGYAGSSLLRGLSSSCREQVLLSSCGAGSSLQWLHLWSTGSRHMGFRNDSTWALVAAPGLESTFVAKNLSCSMACEIFLESTDQTHFLFIGSPLHLPLSYQGNLPTYN